MNICLVATGFSPDDGGGIGTYIFNLSQELTALGHKVFVITKTLKEEKEEIINGVSIYRATSRYISRLESYLPGLAWSQFVAWKIKEIDKRYGIDIVEFPNWEGVGFRYLLKKRRKPVVTRLHTPYFETLLIDKGEARANLGDKFTCWMEKAAVKRSDYLTSATEYHKNFIASAYNIDKNRITLLPLGIQVPVLKELPPEHPNILKLLYVSRLEKRKGVLTLMEAIPKVLKGFSDAEFYFIGTDRPHAPGGRCFKEYFQEKFKDYTEKVHFLGYVSYNELNKHYTESDIFVVPSVYESFGLIYIEAMAYGKPVICCDTGGASEVVENGVTGFLVPASNSDLLAERILELLKNKELRKKMGRNGRIRVQNKFSSRQMAKMTADLYMEAIKN